MREIVIVQSDAYTVDDGEFRTKVESLFHEMIVLGADVAIPERHYYSTDPPDENLVSADRKTTIMSVIMVGDYVQAVKNVEQVLEVVEESNERDPGFRTLTVGDASIAFEQNELAEQDLRQGERIGIPVALIILLVLFGTVAAVFHADWAIDYRHHRGPGDNGANRAGVRPGLLRYVDDCDDRACGGDRLFHIDNFAIQGRAGAGS